MAEPIAAKGEEAAHLADQGAAVLAGGPHHMGRVHPLPLRQGGDKLDARPGQMAAQWGDVLVKRRVVEPLAVHLLAVVGGEPGGELRQGEGGIADDALQAGLQSFGVEHGLLLTGGMEEPA